jgi:hypothetical protein
MAGVFNLTTPRDLLGKLTRELDRLRVEPDNVDHAFNFFTTAEHMLDWLYPGHAGDSQRKKLRNVDPLLATVSHLASGAKHFDHLSSHHKSVHGTARKGGIWAKGLWAPGLWAKGFWAEPRLSITLSGPAAANFGQTITAVALAEKVHDYWIIPGRVP